jgi:hypothetical protein
MEKKSLYGIQSEYMELINDIMEAEGEITPEQSQLLVINKTELTIKASGYIAVINKLKAECNYIDAEVKRLGALKKARKNAEDRLKVSISDAMHLYDIQEIKTELNKINFRKSESVVIECDVNDLPDGMKVYSAAPISKTEIKKMLKAGIEVDGVYLKENKNLQIK